MMSKWGKQRLTGIVLLATMLLGIIIAGTGCVSGLSPIGWSGGAVDDDTLYIGSKEGRLVAVNLTDESRLWSDPLKTTTSAGLFGCSPGAMAGGCGSGPSGVAIYGTPVVYNDLVYIAGYNGKIYAYTAGSLAVRWVYPREGNLEPFVGGMAADDGRLFIGSSDGIIYAFDAATGDKLWEVQTGEEDKKPDKIWSTPVVDGDTVYVASFDKKLYALDVADGSSRWEFEAAGSLIAMPLVEDGTVYIGSFDKYMYAIDATDGSLKWKFLAENWFWARPVLYGGNLYAGCLDKKVYVLAAASGNKMAEYDLGSPVSSMPVVVGGSVIFASRDGIVYDLDTGTGELKELMDVEEDVYGPLTAYGDIVHVHTQDLTLHRVNVDNGAILRSISLERPD